MRSDYGGPAQFSPHGTGSSPIDHLIALAQTLGRGWWWFGAGLGLVVLGAKSARRGADRWRWAMLALSFVLAGPVLASRFNIEPTGIGLFICQRFHMLPYVLLVVPVAVGVDQLIARGQLRWPSLVDRGRMLAVVVPFAFLVVATSVSLPYVQRMHTAAVERGLENTLRSLPVGAVVIVHTDLMHFGLGYLQATRGERLDVTVITWPQVPSPQYRARIARITGIELATSATGARSVEVAARILATGRPLLVDAYGSNIATAYPSYPYGILFRVLPRGSALPSIEELFRTNLAMFERFVLDYEPPGFDDDFATQFHALYARLWATIGGALPAGEARTIANDFEKALAPR